MELTDDSTDQEVATGISRRSFVKTGAAVSLAAIGVAAATNLVGCDDDEDEGDDSNTLLPPVAGEVPDTIAVTADQIVKVTDFQELPLYEYLEEVNSFSLPFGTVVHQINPTQALALVPCTEGPNLISINLLNLEWGNYHPLISQAVGATRGSPNVILYSCRASSSLLVWTELDIGTFGWQVYMAAISEEVLGQPWLLDEGTLDYEVPLLAVADNKAYWTVMPNPDGPARYEDSYLKAAVLNQRMPWVVHTSHGRMITTPLVSEGVLTFAPRVDTKNIYYQLTALSVADDRLLDYIVMPQSMRIYEAIYTENGFCFSVEDSYSYADGLGSYGTYMPLADGQSWLHLYRKPTAAPLLLGEQLVLKSATRVIGIDASRNGYYTISPVADSLNYGDTLAACGRQPNLVVYSNVRSNTILAVPECVLRVYVPVTW